MRPTRVSSLGIAALACAAVAWLIVRVSYTSLPPLPWTGIPALLAVAALEAGAGWDLRRRIAGKASKPPDPLLVSRMLVLAKASSAAAAVVAGLCLGFIGYLSGLLSAATPRHDMVTAASTCGAALILAGAALYLEYCCRVPGNRDVSDLPPARYAPSCEKVAVGINHVRYDKKRKLQVIITVSYEGATVRSESSLLYARGRLPDVPSPQ